MVAVLRAQRAAKAGKQVEPVDRASFYAKKRYRGRVMPITETMSLPDQLKRLQWAMEGLTEQVKRLQWVAESQKNKYVAL